VEHGVTRDDRIVGGLALLLLIVVLAFPWYSVTSFADRGAFAAPTNRPAIQAPYSWAGILAALALVWLLVDLGMQRFLPDKKIPTIRDGRTMRLVLAVAAIVFLIIKLLLHAGNLGWGFIVAAILGVVLVLAALQVSRGASAIPGR
jgi:hypothetical protein